MPTKKQVTPKVVKKAKADSFSASMKLFGKTYVSTGKSLVEALEKLDDGHIPVKGIAVLTVKRGEREGTKIIPRLQLMNLFHPSPWRKGIGLKNIANLFNL